MESQELSISNASSMFVSPIVGMEEAKAKFEQVREFTAKCLTKGIDYGAVPGVKKPSLLKPGAEKLGTLFGLTPRFQLIDCVKNWNGEGNPDNEPFFYFEYKCELYRGGEYVSSCDASCNSWEKKYRYRKGEMVCPNCGKELRKSKDKNEYYCWAKKGGCGATFATNDPSITSQKTGEFKNFDTAEQVNTFQKMAQKRAYVGAILIACNLSEYYTQDIEDMASFAVRSEAESDQIPEMIEGDYTPVPQQEDQFDEKKFLANFKGDDSLPFIAPANAASVPNSDGKPYGELTTEQLMWSWNGGMRKLRKNGLTEEERKMTIHKLAAIQSVLNDKKAKDAIKPV